MASAGKTGRGARSKRRPGLPRKGSVISETAFTSPKGRTYRILRTTEKDPYETGKTGGKKKRRR